MSKKGTKALASATLMSLVLTTALSAGPVKAAQGSVTRIGAADRYATAAQVATQNWKDGAKDVVLVSGEGYADAVSASALAKQLNAPILLTTAGSLNADAKAALATLKPTNVYVVGGNASVSTAVRGDLKAANYTLVELQGANRYETNVAVAKKLVELGVKADNVLLVGGEGFSDALSVAPVAAAKGQILLLGNNSEDSMKSVIDFVKANSSKVTVVGTSNVISDAIYNAVGAVERVNGGASRFETNINVLNKFAADLKADKLFVANASGNGYADALVASALAGKSAAPLVLVDAEGTSATTTALEYIKTKATKTTDLNVVGGTGVVSEGTVKAINEIFNPTTPAPTTGDNTVSEITPVNLNQFEITFNTNVDEDTAEDPANYKVAGKELKDENAHVELISDNTVRITLLESAFKSTISQGDEKTVSVEKGILTEDKSQTIDTFDKKIEFKDIEAPTLKSVSVRGNNKLVVEFSEAVDMSDIDAVAKLIKIDGSTLSNYDTTGLSKAKEAVVKTNGDGEITEAWANKVEFYLKSGLDSGELTVKVKDADNNGILEDAAGFAFKETETTVTVDDVSTQPEIKGITCTDDGEIRVTFDRPMDAKTAVNPEYYQINDKDIHTKDNDGKIDAAKTAKIELKEGDTVVKITNVPSGILKDNTNVLSMTDSVKDAYGNKVDDDTRVSFDKEKDDTKPTVLSATIIDDTTLRVQFSEDVKYVQATNVDNYELKDANDIDLMSKTGVYVKAASSADEKDQANTDTFDIKLDKTVKGSSTYKFDSSKYTLTVENVRDTATDANEMDDQTLTVDGTSDATVDVDDVKSYQKSDTEIAIYFGSEMDSDSIGDKANYYYINGDGDSEDIPDDADITVASDNKSVTIDFDDANKTISSTETGDSIVKKIGVKAVKNASGNEVYPGVLALSDATADGPRLEANTFKLYKDGDDVKAEFKLDTALDVKNVADFKVSGTKADDVDVDGDTVTLTFNEGDSAKAILALGSSAELQIAAVDGETDPSADLAGRIIQDAKQTVYYNNIGPETYADVSDSDITKYYSATISASEDGKTKIATVKITFKTPLDASIAGSYKDDFELVNESKGKNLTVKSSTVSEDGKTLILTIVADPDTTKADDEIIEAGDQIDITAASTDDIDLQSQEDGDGNNTVFVPSDDDKDITSIIVK